MEKEIKERNKVVRERIEKLKTDEASKQKQGQDLLNQGKVLQQKIAQVNTDILKLQGAIEELEKQVSM